MPRIRPPSQQAQQLLAALAAMPGEWRHGYDLCRQLDLKSGTLYPLLMRLEAQGHLEARWTDAQAGRPPRHVYRLSPGGVRLAQSLAEAAPPGRRAPA